MKTPLFFLLLVLSSAAVPLQAQQTLTLQDVVTYASQRHPSVDLAQAATDRARSLVREARAAQRPTANVDANLNRFQEPMVVAPLHGFDPLEPPVFDRTLMQGSVSLSYALFDPARGARIDRAEALAQAAETGEEAVAMQAIADATRAYLRVQSARQTMEAHDRRLRALESERSRARQLVEQGRAARVVLLRADAALSAAQAESAASHADVQAAEKDLARQIGTTEERIRLAQLPPVAPADTAAPSAMEAVAAARMSPELRRLGSQLAAAEASRSEAKALWLPRVNVGGRFVEYASSATSPQGEWQAGVQLNYPLLTGGARQAASDRANADVSFARAELDLAARRTLEAIDRAVAAYISAHGRVAALEAAVRQSEEVARIDRLALNEGAGVQSDYLTAEADLFRARAALTDARAMEILALVELARINGQLSAEWIAQNVESRQ
jgi:outer membrane protein